MAVDRIDLEYKDFCLLNAMQSQSVASGNSDLFEWALLATAVFTNNVYEAMRTNVLAWLLAYNDGVLYAKHTPTGELEQVTGLPHGTVGIPHRP